MGLAQKDHYFCSEIDLKVAFETRIRPHMPSSEFRSQHGRGKLTCNVEVGGLVDAGRDLEKHLRLGLLVGGEGDVHRVARRDDALRPRVVSDRHPRD